MAANSPSATKAHASPRITDTRLIATPLIMSSRMIGMDRRAIIPGVGSGLDAKLHRIIGQTHA
jgi:hypothetical protein